MRTQVLAWIIEGREEQDKQNSTLATKYASSIVRAGRAQRFLFISIQNRAVRGQEPETICKQEHRKKPAKQISVQELMGTGGARPRTRHWDNWGPEKRSVACKSKR